MRITPRICSLGSAVWEQEKHLSTQKHIHHRHTTCNRGSNPAPASSHPDPQPLIPALVRLADSKRRRRGARASHCSVLSQGWISNSDLDQGKCWYGEPKKIRLRLFRLGASNRIPIPRLLSLFILISNIINFLLQSRELLHDRIHIAVNSAVIIL